MDADFSHDPPYLPQFVRAVEHYDLVIGSRYIPGGATPDWKLSRRIISRIGNTWHAPCWVCPCATAPPAISVSPRSAGALDLDGIDLVGYGFLIETTYQCYLKGFASTRSLSSSSTAAKASPRCQARLFPRRCDTSSGGAGSGFVGACCEGATLETKPLVIIPTYNEAENLRAIVGATLAALPRPRC